MLILWRLFLYDTHQLFLHLSSLSNELFISENSNLSPNSFPQFVGKLSTPYHKAIFPSSLGYKVKKDQILFHLICNRKVKGKPTRLCPVAIRLKYTLWNISEFFSSPLKMFCKGPGSMLRKLRAPRASGPNLKMTNPIVFDCSHRCF